MTHHTHTPTRRARCCGAANTMAVLAVGTLFFCCSPATCYPMEQITTSVNHRKATRMEVDAS